MRRDFRVLNKPGSCEFRWTSIKEFLVLVFAPIQEVLEKLQILDLHFNVLNI